MMLSKNEKEKESQSLQHAIIAGLDTLIQESANSQWDVELQLSTKSCQLQNN